jgi:hypothetical protein
MTKITDRIVRGESGTVEFKTSFDEDGIETAFAGL